MIPRKSDFKRSIAPVLTLKRCELTKINDLKIKGFPRVTKSKSSLITKILL